MSRLTVRALAATVQTVVGQTTAIAQGVLNLGKQVRDHVRDLNADFMKLGHSVNDSQIVIIDLQSQVERLQAVLDRAIDRLVAIEGGNPKQCPPVAGDPETGERFDVAAIIHAIERELNDHGDR